MDWMDEQSCFFTDGYAIDGLEYGGVSACQMVNLHGLLRSDASQMLGGSG